MINRAKQNVPQRFDKVASRYDLMAALNPGYEKHLRWSARRLALPKGAKVLDLCCGTGISTMALSQIYPDAEIDAFDASERMLMLARKKLYPAKVHFVQGDAMNPQSRGLKGPYDGILMAYGIRNVPDPDTCLERLRQLLKPGGRICLHEFSVNDSLRSKLIWNAVSLGVIVPMGLLTSPGSDIYRYLRRSVVEFDGVRELEGRLRSMRFTDVRTESMDGWQKGIVHSFLAQRPEAS